jgi:hypothetical protein
MDFKNAMRLCPNTGYICREVDPSLTVFKEDINKNDWQIYNVSGQRIQILMPENNTSSYDKLPNADLQQIIGEALLEGENNALRKEVLKQIDHISTLQVKLKEANEDAMFLYNVVARSVKGDADIGILIEDEEFAMRKHIDRLKRRNNATNTFSSSK